MTAALPTPFVALFWIWVIVSLTIFMVRLFRRLTRPDHGSDSELGELPPLPDPSAPPIIPTIPTGPTGPTGPTEGLGGPGVTPSPAAPFGAADPVAGLGAPIVPSGSAIPPDAPVIGSSSGRGGFFAAAGEDDATAPSAVGAARPTVAEALQGITMPCGLTPVIDGTVSIPNPFRVAFLTTDADAQSVGRGMGDELERLGYRLSTAAATELVARKPGVELHVVLYPTPAAAKRGLDAIFPAAPPDAVGLELST